MLALGIDIGGMSMKFAVVNEKGEIVSKVGKLVTIKEIQEATAIKMVHAIKEFLKEEGFKKSDIAGIGIGCPGTIDSNEGIVRYANNLGWENFKLGKMLEEGTGLKVYIANDANAATLGEVKYGAGKKYNNAIMLTLGTGVGGGIVIDGKLYQGHMCAGGELGHITLDMFSPQLCTCGRYGCFEVYSSATALLRQTKTAMEADKNTKMWDLVDGDINKVDGKTVFDAKELGDKTAIEVVNNYIKYLGEGVLNYCNIFRPEAIIFSGGIANQRENLLRPLREYCKERNWGYSRTPEVQLLIAELGYESGIIGAASLILE